MEAKDKVQQNQELEKQLEELVKCKSFTEVKKKYSKEKMIELLKMYMKCDNLDYESEIENKLEECSEKGINK
jgi:hypothetical protein